MKMFVQLVCSLVVAAISVMTSDSAKAEDVPKKILFFSKSSGYQHDMIARVSGQPSAAEKILAELGKKNNLEFTFTKDGSVFTPENIAKYDAFCFYTTLDLTTLGTDKNPPMPKEGKAAFLQAIHDGKGFVGIHSATDTFHSGPQGVDPYIQMIGGEFVTHDGWVPGHLIVVDKNFPGMSDVPDDFGPPEEWYSLKNFSPNLHVLLAHNTTAMKKQPPYNRPNFPCTWAQQYGKGRVFYTSMGHRIEVWNNPVFQQVLVGGLKWAVGDVEADVTPNIDKVTPEANKL
ncbi:MAG TPA: ThuA domain-containing protein [Verrucomicrobiae bacterium]|jgi:type 1 glutamine amidotransferase|nr:ThuA domain-containing protein [Verrucomicrobiae bacterium]